VNKVGSAIWAITSYFNPVGYKRRLENYRIFRQLLTVPLITAELSFSQAFELTKGDADLLIQIQGRDVMFQKERLLNVALGVLPAECEAIVWLDCDVIFGVEDWVARTLDALQAYQLVHLFEEQYDLLPTFRPDDLLSWNQPRAARSVVCEVAQWEMTPAAFRKESPPHGSEGFAWGARRELLVGHGFYDACIVGGGDSAIYWAAAGTFECAKESMRMNKRRYKHYLDWARPFHAAVERSVSWIQAPIFHLWHGDACNRQYDARHEGMEMFEFDPNADICLSEQGCWQWSSDKPDMHAYVAGYFQSRKEDG